MYTFATNIPKDTLDAIQIGELYRARWQVEISFRILKGFCSLKKCNTHKSWYCAVPYLLEPDCLSAQADYWSAAPKGC